MTLAFPFTLPQHHLLIVPVDVLEFLFVLDVAEHHHHSLIIIKERK
jgi:hypothetical protein